MFVTFTLLLLTTAFLYHILKLYRQGSIEKWKKQGVQILQNDLTLFQLLTAKKAPADFDLQYYDSLGPNKFGVAFELGEPILLLKDLDLVKQIMIKDFDYFPDHRGFISTDPMFSKALFFLQGQLWKDMRTFLSPTFTSGKIRRMFHIFEASSNKLLKYVEDHHTLIQGGFDILVHDVMGRFTCDVIGGTAFGMQTDALSNSDSLFYKMALRSTDFNLKRMAKFALFTAFPKIGNFFNMQSLDKDVSDFFTTILKQALRDRETAVEKREDFLQLLTEARQGRLEQDANDEGDRDPSEVDNIKKIKIQLTEELAIPQAFIFFMAGLDTVANLLGQALYILAVHPEIQEKLYTEVENVMHKNTMSYESANRIEYMDMFISETLRMYPPVTRLDRVCAKQYQVPGTSVLIPEGTVVTIPAEAIHFDPKFYPNPHQFDPERFNPENKAARNPYSYLPFGTGPRNCIGMRLALIEAKVALSHLIHNFMIQPTPGKTPIPIKMWRLSGFYRVPHDLYLRMVPRK